MLHRLERSDSRVIHSRWDPAIRPVLTVAPGDEVIVECRAGDDGQLRRDGTSADVDAMDRSRLHALTGPIEVAGARPGDVLAVHVLEFGLPEWGFTMIRPGAGVLDAEPSWFRVFDIDVERGRALVAPGIELAVAPFLGVMGVAPADGPRSTIAPDVYGGNLDCREAGVGSILRLPVQVPGALFSCGDGHAVQGDGEVCVTALECALTARLRFELETGPATGPTLETPTAWMTLAAAPSVEQATRVALEAMLSLIQARTALDRATAYALASLCVDIRINQLVNRPHVGVRAVLAKDVLSAPGRDERRDS